ncbi:MAG: extracellular solute-binding protein [Candidatus Sumerlaeia bacterium]|nr:extracellular solute-binding protein [Candidatus Sumerlaeia bacterium]
MRSVSLAILLCLFIASCGGGSGDDDSGDILLRLWVFSVDVEQDLRPVLDEFEAANPGIRVHAEQLPWDRGFERILLSLATRRPPDVCELGMTWLAPFAEEGVLVDLTDLLSDSMDERTLVDASSYDGRLYAAPWMVGSRLLFYNRAMLREAGYADARPPSTWAELEEMSARIDATFRDRRAIGIPAGDAEITWQTFYSFLASGRVPLLDMETRQPLIDSTEFRQTLDFYRGLKKHALVDRGPQLDRAFGTGRIAFHVSGAWNFTLLPRDYPTLDYGYSFLPEPDFIEGGTGGGAMAGGQLLVVFRQSPRQEAAKKLLDFLASRPIATRLTLPIRSLLPAFADAAEMTEFRDDPSRVFHARIIERSVAAEAVPYWEEMRRDLVTLLDTAMLTDSPLEGLLEQTMTHWSGLAEEYQ